ncbi:uncharacterized protein apof isoform X2 [Chanos chanos]|nr:apolipoprotein F isoform X2 [Chanos chanos]
MWGPSFRWLLLVHILLMETALGRGPPPLSARNNRPPETSKFTEGITAVSESGDPSWAVPKDNLPSSAQLNISKNLPSSAQLNISKNLPSSAQHIISKNLPSSAQLNISKNLPSSAQLNISKNLPSSAQLNISKNLPSSAQLNISKNLPSSAQLNISKNLLNSAQLNISNLFSSLQGEVRLHGDVGCEGMLSGAGLTDLQSRGALFSEELLGLVLVPVLVSAGCVSEAQTLILRLYTLLGQTDTEDLLQDLLELIQLNSKNRQTHVTHTSSSHSSRSNSSSQNTSSADSSAPYTSSPDRSTSSSYPHVSSLNPSVSNPSSAVVEVAPQRHLQALLFNIQQLAHTGARWPGAAGRRCRGWLRISGVELLGEVAPGGVGSFKEALQACRSLGLKCAGVAQRGVSPGHYHVILRQGSRIIPSLSSTGQSESWVQQCGGVRGLRWRRDGWSRRDCVNKEEERVYTVVEWIPAISTLYNLGTAVYYASVNCSETAKERAILSALDLGTDALMAVTGGTVGVAGYAFGAGVKTGVKAGIKYLLNTMKQEEDLLMNQNSWEEGTHIMQ